MPPTSGRRQQLLDAMQSSHSIAIMPRNEVHRAFHIVFSGGRTDSTMKEFAPQPTVGPSFVPCHGFFHPSAAECVGSSLVPECSRPFRYTPHPKTHCIPPGDIRSLKHQSLFPVFANRACWPLRRRRRAGRHSRLPVKTVLSPFFPRSVGFGPTDSHARGALFILPSTLCHNHASA